MSDTNQAVQPQKMASWLKFWIQEEVPGSNQRRRSAARIVSAQLIWPLFLHIQKAGFLIWHDTTCKAYQIRRVFDDISGLIFVSQAYEKAI